MINQTANTLFLSRCVALSVFGYAGAVSAQGGYSHSQHYALDGNGNRTAITDAAGVTTHQTFDAHNRLTSITNLEGTTDYTWNKDDTLSAISRASGVHSGYQYDRARRITSIVHSRNGATTLAFTFRYDLNGNRTQQIKTQSAMSGQGGSIETTDYRYDGDDRLIAVEVRSQPPSPSAPDQKIEWGLDGVGNRLFELVTRLSDHTVTSSKVYSYSARDQLLMMNDSVNQLSVSYTYSGNGNRTSRNVTRAGQPPQVTSYIYDARDRMIKVQPAAPNAANAPTVEYVYDADSRRVERLETPANGGGSELTLYIYNGSTLLHEAQAASVPGGLRVTDTYRRGTKLDRHVAYGSDGAYVLRQYQLDALDSPVAMTDSAGATVNRTAFDAWGNTKEQVVNGAVQAPWQMPNYNPDVTGQAALLSSDGQSIGYTGYEKDEATGLYYAGNRFYDPLVGSFNAMDSWVGDPTRPVTLNKYLYANGNPLTYTDPTGKYAESGHYYTTYYVALRVGFGGINAQKLAFYSQLPDEVDRLDAVGVQADALGNDIGATLARAQGMMRAQDPANSERDTVQTDLHALTGGVGQAETDRTIRAIERANGDLATTGVLVHRLGDTFAHRNRDGSGNTYETGIGHGFDAHEPDTIQRNPEQYLKYVETLTAVLAKQRGMSDEAAKQLSMQVRHDLAEVANIKVVLDRVRNPDAFSKVPQQQSVALSSEELETMSVDLMRKKVSKQGGNLGYAPENFPSGIDRYAGFIPLIWEAKSLDETVHDVRMSSPIATDPDEARFAVGQAEKLMRQQPATNPAVGCVVTESNRCGR